MVYLFHLFIWALLLSIAYQDFKHRSVYWFMFPVLFVSLFLLALQNTSTSQALTHSLINCSFVLVQLLMAIIYFSIRNRKLTNIFAAYFGLGDLLFLIGISPGFSVDNFILFYVFSLVGAILLFLWVAIKNRKQAYQIPLAGVQAIFLFGLEITSFLYTGINLHNDSHLLLLLSPD